MSTSRLNHMQPRCGWCSVNISEAKYDWGHCRHIVPLRPTSATIAAVLCVLKLPSWHDGHGCLNAHHNDRSTRCTPYEPVSTSVELWCAYGVEDRRGSRCQKERTGGAPASTQYGSGPCATNSGECLQVTDVALKLVKDKHVKMGNSVSCRPVPFGSL
ncbi:hypothetical protein BV22DRAFT_672699 [Leucogyrophana mollusca]|uniref:Uncharacterized protein n=1 Tax=Leucogyrophana mollusca TaxID=85980 RepID=A0ACB8BBN2_9AGAM|nr:hypothetical protein BV22DRAFT_672699 [Leucogyrophana mollusca]